MSELLELANSLMSMEQRNGGWSCFGKYPCLYTKEVIAVIKGYQELIHKVAIDLAICSSYVTNDDLLLRVESILAEVRASLPLDKCQ